MGAKASTNLRQEDIDELHKDTGFASQQIIRLYNRFESLDKDSDGILSAEDFLKLPELAVNPLCHRIIHQFCSEEGGGVGGTDGVNFRQFIRTLARFRPVKSKEEDALNSRQEKLKFVFKMYDVDDDGVITKEELLAILHAMIPSHITDEQLSNIADCTITEADEDKDDVITFEEYTKIMEKVDIEQRMSIRFLN